MGGLLASDLAGRWEGEVLGARRPYRILIDFTKVEEAWQARADFERQADVPLENVVVEEERFSFDLLYRGLRLVVKGRLVDGAIQGEATTEDRRFRLEMDSLPVFKPTTDRNEAWRQDIETVLKRFLRLEKSFEPSGRAQARQRLESLSARVAELSDPQIIVELSRISALSGNAHTRLYLLRNRTFLRRYPIRVYWFEEGLYVIRAKARYRGWLGCRVEAIGAEPVAEVFAKVRQLFSGNDSWKLYKSPYFLTSPEILSGVGTIERLESSHWTLSCAGERKRREIRPLPLKVKEGPTEAWRDLSPHYGGEDGDWLSVLGAGAGPVFLRNPQRHYWFVRLQDQQMLYFQYNRSSNDPTAGSPADFSRKLLEAIREEPLKGMIVDLRFNTGGDISVARPLFAEIVQAARGGELGRLFVVIGRATFSAGIYHAAQLRAVEKAVFIGEPIGDVLDYWSEGGNIRLPNSRLVFHYANGFHSYSKIDRPELKPYFSDLDLEPGQLEPDRLVTMKWADYIQGRDAVLEAIRSN